MYSANSDGVARYDAVCALDVDLLERWTKLPARRLTIVVCVLSGLIICGVGALIAPVALAAMSMQVELHPIIALAPPSPASPLSPPPSLPEAQPSPAAAASPTASPPPMPWPPAVRTSRAAPGSSPPVLLQPPVAPSTMSVRPSHRLWPGAPPPSSSLTLVNLHRRAVVVVGDPLTPAPRQVPSPPFLWYQPPQPPIPPLRFIASLNRQFVLGVPSNSLSEAGVLVHVLDGFERSDVPWSFDPSKPAGDRASASTVNARHPDVYENLLRPIGWQRMPGFVLADAPAQERLSCSYPRDGGTSVHDCDHNDPECRPGCIAWCERPIDWRHCAFPPWRLKEMLETFDRRMPPGHHAHWGYNELVLDTWRMPWKLDMPSMIKAVFVQTGSYESELKYGREVHSKLLAQFGLSEDDIPLLEYNATSASEPFRELGGLRRSDSPIKEAIVVDRVRIT